MATENKTVILKIDLDTSSLKKRATEAQNELVKLKAQQTLLKTENKQGTVEYAKLQEQIKIYTKQLKDNAGALAINENLAKKENLTINETAQARKALSVAYNQLTQDQRENTEEGRKIVAQYAEMNDSINQQALSVNDGRHNVGQYEKSLAGLKQELKDLQNVMATTDANAQEYVEASARAGELRDKLKEVKENTNAMAGGTGFEKMSNTLGMMGDDLMNLDFEGVAEKAGALQEVSSKMTFKEVIAGAKSMGTAMVSLGKTILANPLFLMVAVIASVVGALVWFSQSEETAEAETEKLNASIDRQNALFDLQAEKVRENGRYKLELAKAQGKSTKEIQKIEVENLKNEEKLRRESLALNKKNLQEKKKLYMLSLEEGNEENAKKLHEEIIQDKKAIQTLKLGRSKYYHDLEIMNVNNAKALKEEREKEIEKQKEEQKAIEEKAKENAQKYKERKDAELQLAKDIARKIREEVNENTQLTIDTERNATERAYNYKKEIAQLTISDANELSKALIEIERERRNENLAIDEKERDKQLTLIKQSAQDEIAELKGSKEKIAEQTKLINANTQLQIEAVNNEFANKQKQAEIELLRETKAIEENKIQIAKETEAEKMRLLEASVIEAKALGQESLTAELAIAKEKNRLIQEDEKKTAGEKLIAQKQYEADVIAINKESTDKQLAQEKELADKRKELQDQVVTASQQLVSDLFSFQKQSIQSDLEATTTANNEKLTSLQEQFDSGLISSQDYEAKKLALEQKGRDEERKIKIKQFEADKNAQLIQATIATAVAVAKALPNPITATLAGILGASQIALIASQPTPAFASGGKVLSGKRIGNSDGRRITRSNGDNLLATVKAGEVILNERQQRALGGDRTFARIGVPGFASGGITSTVSSNEVNAQIDSQNAIIRAVASMPSPVVLVQDINDGQSQYSRVVDSASF